MRIGIVGAGVTGLTAGYRLSQKGHRVVVFEKENYVGGLAAGFRLENWGWSLENFFHHLFVSDDATKNLLAELGLSEKLFYRRPKTSIFFKGRISQFDSPLSVLRFPHLSLSQKLRTGLVTAYLKLKTPPRWCYARGTPRRWKLEEIPATTWLKKYYGQKPYKVLWQPLLRAKFGEYASGVSMVWFWARIKKRSAQLGYIEGGFQVLVDKLVEKIKENGGEIHLGQEINSFNHLNNQMRPDRAIFTTPLNSKEFKWVGALNLILILKEPFLTDGTYWLNINDESFPFVAVVEHTNFIDKKHYGGNHILYIGGYYPQEHRYFKMSKEEVFEEFLPFLRRINPSFQQFVDSKNRRSADNLTIQQSSVNLFAQPVIPTNYSKIIPSFKTDNPKVFRANMQMVYPWDRGVNYAIELGERVADESIRLFSGLQ